MSDGNFIKKNFILILGIALPVLMMAFFFVSATLPQINGTPPKYDMIFSTHDYSGGRKFPVTVNVFVKDGVLKAQYTRNKDMSGYGNWVKIYIYEAKTQKLRELPLPIPEDSETIAETRTDIVEATKDLKIDTAQEAPDGYALSYDGYSRSGLVGELFWGGRHSREPRLRNKDGGSVKMGPVADGRRFYYGEVSFLGWVKP